MGSPVINASCNWRSLSEELNFSQVLLAKYTWR